MNIDVCLVAAGTTNREILPVSSAPRGEEQERCGKSCEKSCEKRAQLLASCYVDVSGETIDDFGRMKPQRDFRSSWQAVISDQ